MKEILLSRLSQIFSRIIAGVFLFLAGKFGVDLPTDQLTGSAEVVASLVAAAAFFGFDFIVHRVNTGSWGFGPKVPPGVPYYDAPLIAFLLLPGLLLTSGCVQSTARAKFNNEAQAAAAANYQKNVERLVYALIDDMCDEATAKADTLAAEAEKAETGADGKANAQNLRLIQDKKLAHYKQIELNRMALRGKLVDAAKDMEHLRQYSKALSDYWDKSASTAGLLNQSSEAMIGLLDKFVKGPKAQIIRNP